MARISEAVVLGLTLLVRRAPAARAAGKSAPVSAMTAVVGAMSRLSWPVQRIVRWRSAAVAGLLLLGACADRRIVFCDFGFDATTTSCSQGGAAGGGAGGSGVGGSSGSSAGVSGAAGALATGGVGGGGASGTGGEGGAPDVDASAPVVDAGDAGVTPDAAVVL